MESINNYGDTARQLRLLAQKLDSGVEIPDFVFAIIIDDKYLSAHKAEKDIFGLLGLIEYRKIELYKEVE